MIRVRKQRLALSLSLSLSVCVCVYVSSQCVGRVGGLDSSRNWSAELSPGEQQRLAMARLLTGRPSLAFLDEATSALDLKLEAMVTTITISLDLVLMLIMFQFGQHGNSMRFELNMHVFTKRPQGRHWAIGVT